MNAKAREDKLFADQECEIQRSAIPVDAGIVRLIFAAAEFGQGMHADNPAAEIAMKAMCSRWYTAAALAQRSEIMIEDGGPTMVFMFGPGFAIKDEMRAIAWIASKMELDHEMQKAYWRFSSMVNSMATL